MKIVNREIAADQSPPAATNQIASDRAADTGTLHRGADDTTRGFNRFLYENLICNVESQIEGWNRSAVRNQNPEAAHALWLKAEGLGYAIRLLYSFEPEFRELVERASLVTEIRDPDCTVQHLERESP
jgi:hypothetical protein